MKKIQIYSSALSIGCAVGVLMAVILTSNKTSLPRNAVVVPTKNPISLQAIRRIELPTSLPFQRDMNDNPDGIDRVITSSIPNRNSTDRGIGGIISSEDANPYPGDAGTVIVQSGDTLFGIARTAGVNAHKLAKLNKIDAPFVIRPGQILRLGSSD